IGEGQDCGRRAFRPRRQGRVHHRQRARQKAVSAKDRIGARFAELRASRRAGFIPFITAGDPDAETSYAILKQLPWAGADLIELGMPFSDPMADGPAIQAGSVRALKAGMTVKGTLSLVERF